MKFTQRLGSAARTAAAPARDRLRQTAALLGDGAEHPPHGRPHAVYVGILDGETLWLALEPTPGTIAVRDTGAGQVVPLVSDLPEGDPRYRDVRASLLELPGDGEAEFEVVVVPAVDAAPKPVWTAPLRGSGATRTPTTRDGRHQWEAERSEDGTLRLHRRPLPPAAVLRSVAVVDDGIELVCGEVAETATDLLMLTKEGEVTATFPLRREGDTVAAVLTAAGLPDTDRPAVRLAIGTRDAHVPIRRRADDLAGPAAAVLLPVLYGDDEQPVFRLRAERPGVLAGRLVLPETTTDAGPDAGPEAGNDA